MNKPPRGFLAQTVAAPQAGSPAEKRQSVGSRPLPPDENTGDAGQIRRLQDKIHSEFKAKPTPVVKSPDDYASQDTEKNRSNSDVMKRVQNMETVMSTSPTMKKVPSPISPPPTSSPRSSFRDITSASSPRTSIGGPKSPAMMSMAGQAAALNASSPTTSPKEATSAAVPAKQSSFYSKSMVPAMMNSESPRQASSDNSGVKLENKAMSARKSFYVAPDEDDDDNKNDNSASSAAPPNREASMARRGSYRDVSQQSFPAQKINVGASMIAQKRQQQG